MVQAGPIWQSLRSPRTPKWPLSICDPTLTPRIPLDHLIILLKGSGLMFSVCKVSFSDFQNIFLFLWFVNYFGPVCLRNLGPTFKKEHILIRPSWKPDPDPTIQKKNRIRPTTPKTKNWIRICNSDIIWNGSGLAFWSGSAALRAPLQGPVHICGARGGRVVCVAINLRAHKKTYKWHN